MRSTKHEGAPFAPPHAATREAARIRRARPHPRPTPRQRAADARTPQALQTLARYASAHAKKAGVALAATLVALAGVIASFAPSAAFGDTGRAKVETVPESEFEPIGYEASFDFDGVEIIEGFEAVDDVGVYFDHRLSDGDNPSLDDLYLQVKGHPGLAFAIDEQTEKGTAALRYTNATYNGEAFDAIVTVQDWTYFEPDWGWENFEPYYEGHEVFQPGVYISTHWKSLSDGPEGYQNFNFYTVGLSDFKVSVQFVRAGTDEPIEVKGHATCIDLDTTQAFEFGGAITGGRIVEGNDVLFLENDGTRVCSEHVYLSTDGWKNPDQYRKGLVETFYDTTGENLGKAAEFYFYPGWRESAFEDEGWPDPQSFFALTPDFLTAPNPDENPGGQTEVVKSADKTEGVGIGDEVEYTVDFKAHEQGVNCRVGYHYSALEIVDMLPAEMRYIDGSGYLADENGEPIEGAGTVICNANESEEGAEGDKPENDAEGDKPEGDEAGSDGETGEEGANAAQEEANAETSENAAGNEVRFVFDEEYLASMPMEGEHYRFVFKAALAHYPEDGSLAVRNSSYALINSKGETPSNDVDTGLVKPQLAIEKNSDKETYAAGETGRYTLAVTQIGEGATAENIVVKDALSDAAVGEIIEGSLTLSDAGGEQIAVEPAYLHDEEGRIAGFEIESGTDLALGETLTVSYDVRMAKADATLDNEAKASADNAQEVADANTVAIAAETPASPADPVIALTKEASQDEIILGDTVLYRIVATVQENDATNVVISDESLPDGMPIDKESITVNVDGGAAPGFDAAAKGNGFSISIDTLKKDSVVEIEYAATAENEALEGEDVVNTAVLTADGLENPLRDEARVSVLAKSQAETPPAANEPPAADAGNTPPDEPKPTGKFVKTGDELGIYAIVALVAAGVAIAALAAAVAAKRRHTSGRTERDRALARATEFGASGE